MKATLPTSSAYLYTTPSGARVVDLKRVDLDTPGLTVSDLIAVEQAEAYADARVREAQQWQPIETAPKDGTEVIVYHPEAGVCAAFCPTEGFAWHCMDGQNTVIGRKSGRSIPSMTSFINPPTHWMPLPAPPQQ